MTPDPKPVTIRLKGKARTKLRIKVGTDAKERCSVCGGPAPIYWEDYSGKMIYRAGICGELSHGKSVGSGGEDTEEGTCWKCWPCHRIKEHGPRWSGKSEVMG